MSHRNKENNRLHHREQTPQNISTKKSCPADYSQLPAQSYGHGENQVAGELPKCVCAPATHAGSFRCRLHRANSHSQSATPASSSSALATSTRTVEAQ
ncbi:unnamed protein product [Spirodela intermedia]|uniref:Uncharacterized protein n=1 Tax=Spirodela intermedia TaxID=51605 RepID=A0A7I8KU84_SPIIN|nr:unnamed protein product [Spirodela intermedia]